MTTITLDVAPFLKPALALVLTFLIAQALKMFNDARAGHRVLWVGNGGMPSSHTATVVGLAMVVLFEQGLSLLFLAVVVGALIVINDAVGVRWEASRHSLFLNELSKKEQFKIVGHRPLEVLAGAAVGVIVPVIVYSLV